MSIDHELFWQDDEAASKAVKRMREEHPENQAEITRLKDIAETANKKLRQHVAVCPGCKANWSVFSRLSAR